MDEALEPLTHLKRKGQIGMLIFGLVSMAIVLPFIFGFRNSSGDGIGLFFLPVIGFFVISVAFWALIIISNRQSNKVREELKKVCQEQSSKDPMISFHLREDTRIVHGSESSSSYTIVYLEVQVNPNDSSASTPSTPFDGGIPMAASVFESKSVEMRLEELERLKPQLSEEEYRRKREDILSMV